MSFVKTFLLTQLYFKANFVNARWEVILTHNNIRWLVSSYTCIYFLSSSLVPFTNCTTLNYDCEIFHHLGKPLLHLHDLWIPCWGHTWHIHCRQYMTQSNCHIRNAKVRANITFTKMPSKNHGANNLLDNRISCTFVQRFDFILFFFWHKNISSAEIPEMCIQQQTPCTNSGHPRKCVHPVKSFTINITTEQCSKLICSYFLSLNVCRLFLIF